MFKLRISAGCLFSAILAMNLLHLTLALPQLQHSDKNIHLQIATSNNSGYPDADNENIQRKFAVKPNASKKVSIDDIDEDIETNQIQDNAFSWSNVLTTVMQMFFNNNAYNAPSKSDDIDGSSVPPSPWTNAISLGLKIFNAVLGGYQSDNIDKVDNGGSPLQGILAAVFSSVLGARNPDQVNTMAKQAGEFINIVINLLDALKTSFSHRSLAARSIGKRDSISDAAVAGISMLKTYARTYQNTQDPCIQKYMCEANSECVKEIGGFSIFCQLGTYATSFLIERTQGSNFESLYEAGRHGRSISADCEEMYIQCNRI